MMAVLEAAESVDESTAAVVWAMARAGARIGEALALRRGDVDGTTLHIRGSMSRNEGLRPVKGKNGAGRSIPIPTDLAARLSRHIASQTVTPLEGWLFTAPRGGQLRYDNWRTRTWRQIVEVAGIGEVKPHDLRHTVATSLFVRDGWTVPQVQAYLGHVDPAVTLKVYSHVNAESLPRPSDGHFADTLGR
ncbi:MAG: site-specific integrase [bacterium]|nr:site-specific integrase [bacterium]